MRLLSTVYGACSISAGLFCTACVPDRVAGPAAPTNLGATSSTQEDPPNAAARRGRALSARTPTQAARQVGRIPPLFFGINAWMPKQIGTEVKNGDLEQYLCGVSYVNPGDACIPAEIKASGVEIMRYGGSAIEHDYDVTESPAQYAEMVDNMRDNGIEPVLQVPYGDGTIGGRPAAEVAAELVTYINVTNNKDVKVWSAGNELDKLQPVAFTAQDIRTYFKEISQAMKDVDPEIIITGPDLSSYSAPSNDAIMNSLTDCGFDVVTGDPVFGPDDITGSLVSAKDNSTRYYVDILNFHAYPFDAISLTEDLDGDGDIDGDDANRIAYTRADVIAHPVAKFEDTISRLQVRVDACNAAHNRMGKSALKKVVTEMNVTKRNPTVTQLSVEGVDEYASVGATSFLAGQYWAEVMSIGIKNGLEGITFWSVKEGDNLGYIKSDSAGGPPPGGQDGRKLSTYYHFQMMAKHFRGTYAAGTDYDTNSADIPEVKAFGSKAVNQIVVMILNQSQSTDYAYTVGFMSGVIPSGSNPLKIAIDAAVPTVEYNSSQDLTKESTVLLVFDGSGNIKRRHVYSLADAQSGGAPQIIR